MIEIDNFASNKVIFPEAIGSIFFGCMVSLSLSIKSLKIYTDDAFSENIKKAIRL